MATPKVQVTKTELVITLPLLHELSSTRKSILVGCTHGYQDTTAEIDGKTVRVNATAIISARE